MPPYSCRIMHTHQFIVLEKALHTLKGQFTPGKGLNPTLQPLVEDIN